MFLDRKEKPYSYDRYAFNYVSKDLPYLSKKFQIMKLLNKDLVNLLFEYKDYILKDENIGILRYEEGMPDYIDNEGRILDEAIEEMNIAYDNFTSLQKDCQNAYTYWQEKNCFRKKSDYEKAVAIEQFFTIRDLYMI